MTLILHNGPVLTMDAADTLHEPGHVVIEGDRIAAVGAGAPPEIPGAEVIDLNGDLVMPGFVNAHAHLPMTLFRGLGEDVDDRLFRYVLPLERKFVTPEMVRIGTTLATLESIEGGTTTVADMYYFETEVAAACDRAGLRCVAGQTLADFDPPDHRSMDEGFARTEELVSLYRGHPRIIPSIAPHAPYSTGPAVMARVAQWAADNPDVPVQLHLAEMDSETDWARREHGCSPVEVTRRSGLLREGLIAAHVLNVDDADIAALAEAGVRPVHNVRSNAKAGRGIAPVERMRAAGLTVALGTDGPMSGNTLDLFSQLAPASMGAKLLRHSRKPLPAKHVLRMATIDGAVALGMGALTGSLEPGKAADLIRLDLSAPRLQPIYDLWATLVFAALPCDVTATMVAGRWLMRDRQVLTVERRAALRDAGQIAARFKAEMAAIDATTPR